MVCVVVYLENSVIHSNAFFGFGSLLKYAFSLDHEVCFFVLILWIHFVCFWKQTVNL